MLALFLYVYIGSVYWIQHDTTLNWTETALNTIVLRCSKYYEPYRLELFASDFVNFGAPQAPQWAQVWSRKEASERAKVKSGPAVDLQGGGFYDGSSSQVI